MQFSFSFPHNPPLLPRILSTAAVTIIVFRPCPGALALTRLAGSHLKSLPCRAPLPEYQLSAFDNRLAAPPLPTRLLRTASVSPWLRRTDPPHFIQETTLDFSGDLIDPVLHATRPSIALPYSFQAGVGLVIPVLNLGRPWMPIASNAHRLPSQLDSPASSIATTHQLPLQTALRICEIRASTQMQTPPVSVRCSSLFAPMAQLLY